VTYSYTDGSVDGQHAFKHGEKMEALQEVTGNAKIDAIFDKEFLKQVRSSYNASRQRSRQRKSAAPEQEEEEHDDDDGEFGWLDE